MAVELATAYFTLLPSMKGTAAAVTSQLGAVEGAAVASGARTGAAMGGGLVAGFGKFVPILGGILAGAGIVSVFQDSAAAASDLNESVNAVKVTYGDLAGEINNLSTDAAENLGLSKNDFNALAVRFSSFARQIAGEGGDVVGTIDELTTRGADFASVYNLEVDDALARFQSGLAGQSEPLAQFGINLLDSNVKAYAYANGIAEVGSQLTETEKVQARYGLLMQATSPTQGDFANTSDQLANSQRILAANMEDARAKLGDALLPALTKITEYGIEKGVPLFEKFAGVMDRLEPAIGLVADGVLGLAGYMTDNLTTVLDFFDAFEDGNLTLNESVGILKGMPAPLQSALLGTVNFISGIINGFLGGVQGVVNTAVGAINAFLRAVGVASALGTVSLTRLGTISLRAPSTGTHAYMAEGGVVTSATRAVVGEGRYPEAVIPLRPDVLAEIGASIPASGGDETPRLLRRLIEAVQQRQTIEADGFQIAQTSSRGSAFGAAIGAT